ncbi:hypothetical protein BsWGS_16930 [Bradybaena similaris]
MFTITSTVPGSAFEASISITGNAELAGTITITCSWTLSLNEYFVNVLVRSLPAPYYLGYYYQFNQGVPQPSLGRQRNDRMSFDIFKASDERAVVRIANLQYSDKQNYSCYFQTVSPGSPNVFTEKTSFLTVRARSSTMSIILTPSNVTAVKESSFISAFCATNVCQPGRGIIQWKIYRSGVLDVIQATDSRLDEMKKVDLEQAEDKCSHHIEQTFKIRVTSAEQNLVIACFVQIDGGQTLNECLYPATDLCNKTEKITIEVTKPESKTADIWQAYGLLFIASFFALLLAIAAAVLLLVYLQEQKVKKKEPADAASEIEGESSDDEGSEVDS